MTRAAATTLPLTPWIAPVPRVERSEATTACRSGAGLRPVGESAPEAEETVRIRTRRLRLGTVGRPWEVDPRTLRSLESAAGRPLEINAGVEIADWSEVLARLDGRHVVDVRIVSDASDRRILEAVRRLSGQGLAVRVHRRPGHDSEARLRAFVVAARAAGAVDVEVSRPRFQFGQEDWRRTGLRRLRLQLGLPRVAAARG